MNVKGVVWKLLWILALLPVLCSATGYDSVKFSLKTTDIQAIAEHDDSMWIQLCPSAASRLQTITAQSYGKQLIIDIDGISAFGARIYSTTESGVIQVDNPSPEVRRRLERFRSLR